MGDPVRPQVVKLFTGVLCGKPELLADIRQLMEQEFGAVDYVSPSFPFDLTNYYESEMGKGIERYFWSFERLIDPARLPDIKLLSNEIEDRFADTLGNRPVNLDPGYLDFYKMVLASVKERAQKIYLGKGIYADPTLHYLKGKWYAYDWSLPDFRPDTYHQVFSEIRELYRLGLRNLKPDDIEYLWFDVPE